MKRLTRVLSFALVILIGLSGLPSNIASAADSGEILRDMGILVGDLDGDLLLDQPLKRQDVIVLLSRLLGAEDIAKNYPGTHSFTDVTDPYYDPFIAWAEETGLTEGIGNGLFGFNQLLTNQQLLAFLLRSLGYEFYGDDYMLVPAKSVELMISPADEDWSKTTSRQLMADRTVTLLRTGRIKAGNLTLERSLALNDDALPSNGQLFQFEGISVSNQSALLSFSTKGRDYNSSRSNTTSLRAMTDRGPDIGDIEIALRIDGHVTVLKLILQFYDQTTGQMLVTFDPPEIPDDSTISITATYLENRKLIAHEAAHVVQQKNPGTYEPGELLLMIEEIIRDLLPSNSGSFGGTAFNNGSLHELASNTENPLYEQNSQSADNPIYQKNADSFYDIFTEITLDKNVLTIETGNFFIHYLLDGVPLEAAPQISLDTDLRTISALAEDLQIPDGGKLQVLTAYINNANNADQYSRNYGFRPDLVRDAMSELILQMHLSMKPDALSLSAVHGKITLHRDSIHVNPMATGGTVSGIVTGNSLTNPEIDDEVIVSRVRKTMQDLKSVHAMHDYGDEFRSPESAARYFLDYLDPDSDGDGIVFLYNGTPVRVTKPIDKASPLLMVADGGLGDHVTLYLENGEAMFWYDGVDDDCDGFEDEMKTVTYIDSVTVDEGASSLKIGRNPQTGKEIKIAAATTIVITDEDGFVTTHSPDSFSEEVLEEVSFAYAKVTADENGNAILIHIINNAGVVYLETRELDKSSTKIMWTNIPDLTGEEIEFLLSGQVDAEVFVYRQQYGPVSSSSARFYNQRKLAEYTDYSPAGTTRGNKVRFKAGSDLSGKVNIAPPDNFCSTTLVGDSPDMESAASFLKFEGVDGEARVVLVVDSFFDIFTELSADFRGHVTVLK